MAGAGELFVNGEKVDEVEMPHTHMATFSLSEAFDVGRDTGTQVSNLYTDEFHFKGDLNKVDFELFGATETDPKAELAEEEGN